MNLEKRTQETNKKYGLSRRELCVLAWRAVRAWCIRANIITLYLQIINADSHSGSL